MKSRKWMYVALFAALTATIQMSAQNSPPRHHVYKLMPSGTFGGPSSGITVVGGGLLFSDPAGCNLSHAPMFKDGALTDLGALPGGSSASYALNDHGRIGDWIERSTDQRRPQAHDQTNVPPAVLPPVWAFSQPPEVWAP
jgi:hypothetical protein